MYWIFNFSKIISVIWLFRSVDGMPYECNPRNHTELVGAANQHRVLSFRSLLTKPYNDSGLEGWFRFRLAKEDRLLELSELPDKMFAKDRERFKPCGVSKYNVFHRGIYGFKTKSITSEIFALNDVHPTRKYELSIATAATCYYSAYISLSPNRDQCKRNQTTQLMECTYHRVCGKTLQIAVRNCGDYFVYKPLEFIPNKGSIVEGALGQPNRVAGIFCGTDKAIPKVDNRQCSIYKTVKGDYRNWTSFKTYDEKSVKKYKTCHNDKEFTYGWVRFDTDSDKAMKIAENCPSTGKEIDGNDTHSYCDAFYRGWIQGSHPTVEEGRVTRTICFSLASSCKCEFSQMISIMNCGTFYVYKRRQGDFPHCLARACTVLDGRVRRISRANSPLLSSIIDGSASETVVSSQASIFLPPNISLVSSVHSFLLSEAISSSTKMVSTQNVSIISSEKTKFYQAVSASGNVQSTPVSYYKNSFSTDTASSSKAKSSLPTLSSTPKISSVPAERFPLLTTKLQQTIRSSQSVFQMMSSHAPTTKPDYKPLDLCNNYETVIDDARMSSAIGFLDSRKQICSLRYRPAARFVSSQGANLQLQEGCHWKDQYSRRCSMRNSNVWLAESHPNTPGVHVTKVCVKEVFETTSITNFDFCNCERKDYILAQLCKTSNDEFYVYRLHPIYKRGYSSVELDAKACSHRFCTEHQPGARPKTTSKTTTTTTSPESKKKVVFGIRGSFTISNPIINYERLTIKHIKDKTSSIYKFLLEIITDKLAKALRSPNVHRFKILDFRIGSLIVDYEVYGTKELTNEKVDQMIQSSFKTESHLSLSIQENTFSGSIDPESQKLEAIDQCDSNTCHVNATCTNYVSSNTFSCECQENFVGDGFECEYIDIKSEPIEKQNNDEWSKTQIIVVAALSGVCLLLIIMLCCVYKKTKGYTSINQVERNGRSIVDYYGKDFPLKEKSFQENSIPNIYIIPGETDAPLKETSITKDEEDNEKEGQEVQSTSKNVYIES